MNDIEQGALELESGTVDLEDIDSAYEEGTNDGTENKGNQANAQ